MKKLIFYLKNYKQLTLELEDDAELRSAINYINSAFKTNGAIYADKFIIPPAEIELIKVVEQEGE